MHAVGHAHPVEEVADREGEPVLARRDDADRLDHRGGDRGPPVREQLAHGGVELLVPDPARHEQVGVVLALGQTGAQAGGVVEEARPVGDDEPPRCRDDLAPEVEGRERLGVGQHRLGHEERDLPTGCLHLAGDLLGLPRGPHGSIRSCRTCRPSRSKASRTSASIPTSGRRSSVARHAGAGRQQAQRRDQRRAALGRSAGDIQEAALPADDPVGRAVRQAARGAGRALAADHQGDRTEGAVARLYANAWPLTSRKKQFCVGDHKPASPLAIPSITNSDERSSTCNRNNELQNT